MSNKIELLMLKYINMKYVTTAILSTILLIIWMVVTLALTCTLIGIIIILDKGSPWGDIPKKLLTNWFEKKQ